MSNSLWPHGLQHTRLSRIGNKRRYRCTSFSWPKTKTLMTQNAGEDVQPQELSSIAGRNTKWYSPLWKTVWQFLTRLNITVWSSTYSSWYLSKGIEVCGPKNLNMVIGALFLIGSKIPTCCGTTKSASCKYWAQETQLESVHHKERSHMMQWRFQVLQYLTQSNEYFFFLMEEAVGSRKGMEET